MPQPRVLVVDDEPSVLSFADRVLSGAGFAVATAPNGPAALRIIERDHVFDVFVVDLNMPEMDGAELARRIRIANRDAKILYFTGYADALFERRQVLWEGEAFVEKPVTVKGLIEAVSLLMTGRTGPRPS